MPTLPSKPVRPPIAPRVTKSGKSYVALSDKLTKSLQDVSSTIEENRIILDTIQELGIDLSQTVSVISASALKYANMVNSILDTITPFLSSMPFIPKQTQAFLKDLNAFADKFIATCQKSQTISGSLETGLVSGDMAKLKQHSADLKSLTQTARALVPAVKK